VIVPRCGEHLVASAQHVLPHYVRRHVRIARLGQITVSGAADETALALRIEPACGLSIGYDGSYRCARNLFIARRIRLLPSALLLPLSSASALVAAASSVVTIVALTGMPLLLLLIAISLLAATHCLRIVLLLLATRIPRPVRRSNG
jgi:hypothetical protein